MPGSGSRSCRRPRCWPGTGTTRSDRPWGPSPIDDQQIARRSALGRGDLVALLVVGIIFVQWMQALRARGAARGPAARRAATRPRAREAARDGPNPACSITPVSSAEPVPQPPEPASPGSSSTATTSTRARGRASWPRSPTGRRPPAGRRWSSAPPSRPSSPRMDEGGCRRRDPRRRGRPRRRHGHLPAGQGRDLPVPPDPRAHRAAAGRLAGRPGRAPTPRCRTRSTRSRSPARSPTGLLRARARAPARSADPGRAWLTRPGRACSARCCTGSDLERRRGRVGHGAR